MSEHLPRHWQEFDSRWSRASRFERFIIVSVVLHIIIAFAWGIPKYLAYEEKKELLIRKAEEETQMQEERDEQLSDIEETIRDEEIDQLADDQLREFYDELAADMLDEETLESFWDELMDDLADPLGELNDYLAGDEFDELQAEEMIQDIKGDLVDELYGKVADATQEEWKNKFLESLKAAAGELAKVYRKEVDRRIANGLSHETEAMVRNEVSTARNEMNKANKELDSARRDAESIKRDIDNSKKRISDEQKKITAEQKRQDDIKAKRENEENPDQQKRLDQEITKSDKRITDSEKRIQNEATNLARQEGRIEQVADKLERAEEHLDELAPEIAEAVAETADQDLGQAVISTHTAAEMAKEPKPEETIASSEDASQALEQVISKTNQARKDLYAINNDKAQREDIYELLAELEEMFLQEEFMEAFEKGFNDQALPLLLEAVNKNFEAEANKRGLMPPKISIDEEAREILITVPSLTDPGATATYRLNQRYKLDEREAAEADSPLRVKITSNMENVAGKVIDQHMDAVLNSAISNVHAWLPRNGPELSEEGAQSVVLLDRLGNMRNQMEQGRDDFLGKGDHSAIANARQRAQSLKRLTGRIRGRRSSLYFDKEAFLAMVAKMKNREESAGAAFELQGEQARTSIADEAELPPAAFILAPEQEAPSEAPDNDAEREYQKPEFPVNRFAGIAFVNEPIVLDGDLSEWKAQGVRSQPLTYVKGRAPAEQFKDQKLWLAYDANGLYVALECKDPTGKIENNVPLDQFWFNECIEVFIDSLNTKYSRRGERHTHQFFLFPFGHAKDKDVGGYEAYYKGTGRWMEGWKTLRHGQDKLPRGAKKTADGFTLEFMLSRSLIRMGEMKPGRIIGFDLSYCTGTDTYFYWTATEGVQTSTNPHSWGDIQFLGSDATLKLGGETSAKKQVVIPGQPLTVQVTDGDMNLNARKKDRVRVSVISGSGDYEELVLEETDVSSGIFEGSIATRPTIGTMKQGIFEVFEGEHITVTYIDQAQAYGERNIKVEEDFYVTAVGQRVILGE